jgi:outer membrane protein
MKYFILIGVFAFTFTQAQAQKMGYIDVEYVVSQMPEAVTAGEALENYYNQLIETLNDEYTNLEKMEGQFDSLAALDNPPRVKLQMLGEKINMGYQSLQEMQVAAEEEISNKELQLYEPIYEKVDKSLKAYAEREGFDLIYRIESLAFANEESLIDISDAVIEEAKGSE